VEIQRRLTLPGPPEPVFDLVDDLAQYPQWMQLVYCAVGADQADDTAHPGCPAWEVELRARVGPLARSKRLRMVRTEHRHPHVAVFEREETDGRAHAAWVLRADLDEVDGDVELTMTLRYGGSLWTGAVLQRVLDDEIRRGSEALYERVSAEPMP
jgi:hypothetical protein